MKGMARALTYAIIIALIVLVAGGCVHTPTEKAQETPRATDENAPQQEPETTGQADSSGPPAQPPEEPEREPSELIQTAQKLSPDTTYPIRRNSTVLAQVVDADGNGELDVGLLTVGAEQWDEPPRFEELSKRPQASTQEEAPPEFFFELYLSRPDGLVLFEKHRIGRFPLIEGFHTRELSQHGGHPVALAASFQDRIGHKEHWLVVGPSSISTFVLQQTPTVSSRVVDIDDDGVLDVLKAQSAFEQGRGNETFLTWYKWNAGDYASHATTNIVRNLNTFLRDLEDHLGAGRYEPFLHRARPLKQPESEADSSGATSADEQIGSLFEPEEETTPLQPLLENREVSIAAFPRLLENPFPSPGERTAFIAPVRIEVESGASYYYRTAVMMSQNPFEPPQFRLASPDLANTSALADEAVETN